MQSQQVFGFQQAHSEEGAGAEENRGDVTISRVETWLDRVDAGQPQLLWVHFIDPHTPDNCPAPFPQTYEGEVEFTDTLVGRLLQGWDDKIGADRSIAAITADHGACPSDTPLPHVWRRAQGAHSEEPVRCRSGATLK